MRCGLCLFVAAAGVALSALAVPHAAAVDYPVFHEIGPLPLTAVTAPGSASTVRGLASVWRADDLFTAWESRAVAVVAVRSDVGR